MATVDKINEEIDLEVKNFSFRYAGSETNSLKNVSLPIAKNKVTALIGPSGCGKTTLLRSLNRIHDLYHGNKYFGEIKFEGHNILDENEDLIHLRTRIGMIFQKPTAFPMSIYDNVAYGLKLQGVRDHKILDGKVAEALKGGALYDEVKNRLHDDADSLSGGQQQRLCIARAIAVEPEILLFDEPTSALDPISTIAIESLIKSLKDKVTIVIVTHNMQQAQRISDYTAFMYLGELIEFGKTSKIFSNPDEDLTKQYISGKFG